MQDADEVVWGDRFIYEPRSTELLRKRAEDSEWRSSLLVTRFSLTSS